MCGRALHDAPEGAEDGRAMTYDEHTRERARRHTERGLTYIFWLLMVQNALLFATLMLCLLVVFGVLS